MINITPAQIQNLAPRAKDAYRKAFADAGRVLARYAINENPLRVAHFMAQVLHETGGLTVLVEDLDYRAERIAEVWPSRFRTAEEAKPFAHDPAALANEVYGSRMGNTEPGDGWRFIGRGFLQLTGREPYEHCGRQLGIDLTGDPDLAFSAEWALPVAAVVWTTSSCNALADADDVRAVTRAINGGTIGLASREEWLARTKQVWIGGEQAQKTRRGPRPQHHGGALSRLKQWLVG